MSPMSWMKLSMSVLGVMVMTSATIELTNKSEKSTENGVESKMEVSWKW